jgi:hypothetical protein
VVIAEFGGRLADCKRTLLKRPMKVTDLEIEALVYHLCGLTDEEIKIVEYSMSGWEALANCLACHRCRSRHGFSQRRHDSCAAPRRTPTCRLDRTS